VVGVQIAGGDRNSVGAKSPLTGGVIISESGGLWAAELKHAGFDGIIVDGKAEKPVYLWIEDGEVSIRDAGHLWGKQTKETLNAIREELGDNRIKVTMIGPAGENLVRYACIMNGLHDTAGRGGAGAVMGSKNLKAIAVRGHNRPEVASPEGVKEMREWLIKNKALWAKRAKQGTQGVGTDIEVQVATGNCSVNNFRDGVFAEAKLVDCQPIKVGMDGCFACPIRCKRVMESEEPYVVDRDYGGPEYESLGTLGPNCGVSDIKAISRANQLCNANSLDTISTGVTVSFAMECFENGLLTTEDTGGIDLRFGNAEALIKTIELIAKREGIGDVLAEGAAKAARKIGKGAEKFSMDVKGLEIPMHEPRWKHALGIGYMVNPHGADHMCNIHDHQLSVEGPLLDQLRPTMGILDPLPIEDYGALKVSLLRTRQFDRIMRDSLLLCEFVPWSNIQMVEITKAVTGWDTSMVELFRAAERILTIFRLINIREGLTAEDDRLPERFFHPKSGGALADKPCDKEKMEEAKRFYYTLMGWDPKTGIPLEEKVEELLIP